MGVLKRRSFLHSLGLVFAPGIIKDRVLCISCPGCGFGNSTLANYCADCGKPMRPPPPAEIVVPPLRDGNTLWNGQSGRLLLPCPGGTYEMDAVLTGWALEHHHDIIDVTPLDAVWAEYEARNSRFSIDMRLEAVGPVVVRT